MKWRMTHILNLASDQQVIRAGRNMAHPEKWRALGHQTPYLWGIFANKSKPYQVNIDLTRPTIHCNCTSRKSPCVHALGLLMLWLNEPNHFTKTTPPHPHTPTIVPAQNFSKATQPHPTPALIDGLDELKLWLHDLIRNGLASIEEKPSHYWAQMADRLIDAHAYRLARWVRRLVRIPNQHPNWPDHLLRELGRLYLLLQGFAHFSTLPPPTQADLIAAVDWHMHTPTTNDTAVSDQWLVLGRQGEQIGRHYIQNSWVWGQKNRQMAQVTDITASQRTRDLTFIVGTSVTADLAYLPSATPLQARLLTHYHQQQPDQINGGYKTIAKAWSASQQAITRNPWLTHFPLLLQNIQPYQQNEQWHIVDEAGHTLPLPPQYKLGWELMALSGGHPISLFGLWNGHILKPLSTWSQDQVRFLQT